MASDLANRLANVTIDRAGDTLCATILCNTSRGPVQYKACVDIAKFRDALRQRVEDAGISVEAMAAPLDPDLAAYRSPDAQPTAPGYVRQANAREKAFYDAAPAPIKTKIERANPNIEYHPENMKGWDIASETASLYNRAAASYPAWRPFGWYKRGFSMMGQEEAALDTRAELAARLCAAKVACAATMGAWINPMQELAVLARKPASDKAARRRLFLIVFAAPSLLMYPPVASALAPGQSATAAANSWARKIAKIRKLAASGNKRAKAIVDAAAKLDPAIRGATVQIVPAASAPASAPAGVLPTRAATPEDTPETAPTGPDDENTENDARPEEETIEGCGYDFPPDTEDAPLEFDYKPAVSDLIDEGHYSLMGQEPGYDWAGAYKAARDRGDAKAMGEILSDNWTEPMARKIAAKIAGLARSGNPKAQRVARACEALGMEDYETGFLPLLAIPALVTLAQQYGPTLISKAANLYDLAKNNIGPALGKVKALVDLAKSGDEKAKGVVAAMRAAKEYTAKNPGKPAAKAPAAPKAGVPFTIPPSGGRGPVTVYPAPAGSARRLPRKPSLYQRAIAHDIKYGNG